MGTSSKYSREKGESVPVIIWLIRAGRIHPDIISLFLGKDGQVGTDLLKMQAGYLFIETLRQEIDPFLIFTGVAP